jgi:hypothetical protein
MGMATWITEMVVAQKFADALWQQNVLMLGALHDHSPSR